jgi:hypothetical protein
VFTSIPASAIRDGGARGVLSMNLKNLVAKLEALSDNLEFAQSVRERVRIADRIYEALNEIEQRVETFVVKEIGQSNGSINTLKSKVVESSGETPNKNGRFADLSIAGAAKILLKEHGVLHGKEIEKLLTTGGYLSNSKKFQTTMVVALRRDAGFVNIGGNRWKLKEAQTAN